MERTDTIEKLKDYIKNNSFFIFKDKILKFKYFNKKFDLMIIQNLQPHFQKFLKPNIM